MVLSARRVRAKLRRFWSALLLVAKGFTRDAESVWLQTRETDFTLRAQRLRGPEEFASSFLSLLATLFEISWGEFYVRDGNGLRKVCERRPAWRKRENATEPPLPWAEILLARDGAEPRCPSPGLAVALPLVFNKEVLAVAALCFPEKVGQFELDFLKKFSGSSGTALRSLLDRIELEKTNKDLLDAHKKLEEHAFELARISRFKSDFVANVSHELRTPLNSVIILAELLARNRDQNLNPDQLRYLGIIHRSARDLLFLIDDVLELSRVEAGYLPMHFDRVPITSLIQVLEDFGNAHAARTHVEFSLKLGHNLPEHVFTDEMRLTQVVRNFLVNAFKFTPQGGKVTLEVRTKKQTKARHRSPAHTLTLLELAVADTGPGIPEENLGSIFEAFNQLGTKANRDYGGAGLGLAIASQLSKLLAGEIEVETSVGKGSTFRIQVPIDRVRRIVVVAPDDDRWRLLAQALERQDVNPLRARSLRQALVLIESVHCEVLLLDIRNPDDGVRNDMRDLELRSELKRLPPAVVYAPADPFKRHGIPRPDFVRAVFVHDSTGMDDLALFLSELHTEETDLPFPESEPSPTTRAVPDRLKPLPSLYCGLRALVIDDDMRNLFSLKEIMTSEGFDVDTVTSGAAAIESMRQGRNFDLVLCDLMMPGMDGAETLAGIRALPNGRTVPVFIVSAKVISDEEERRRLASASAFLAKPLQLATLQEQLELHLGHRHVVQRKPKVLILDDCEFSRAAIRIQLEEMGANADACPEADEALGLLGKTGDYDLVLSDLNMPRVSGREFLRRLRSSGNTVRVVALTADSNPELHRQLRDEGFMDVFVKPPSLPALQDLLARLHG